MPKHLLTKIISGGQTGADQAGLWIAVKFGIETGGWAPKGWKTSDGRNARLEDLGLREHTSEKYPPRTFANVRDSDGTIRLAFNLNSAGERCTEKAIRQYDRPSFDVDLRDPVDPARAATWIRRHNIRVLNVAGNRENKSNTVFPAVASYLKKVLRCLGHEEVQRENRFRVL